MKTKSIKKTRPQGEDNTKTTSVSELKSTVATIQTVYKLQNGVRKYIREMDSILRPCLLPRKFCKIFHIPRHIESLDVYMEY